MPATRSVDLLATEVDVLWDRDARGRLRQAHHAVVGVAEDGHLLAVGEDVPDVVAGELAAAVGSAVGSAIRPRLTNAELSRPPEVLAYCRQRIVDALGPVVISGGPSYLVPQEGRPDTESRTYDLPPDGVGVGDGDGSAAVRIVRSDDAPDTQDALHAAIPGTWHTDEWADLLAGRLGPWAVAVRGSRVLAVAHTPVADAKGAEAGVWTHPDARGRGLAATVTAHWATLARDAGRLPFYSTSADNLSSQRVAARLTLRPIGWLWKLSAPDRLGVHAHRTWHSG